MRVVAVTRREGDPMYAAGAPPGAGRAGPRLEPRRLHKATACRAADLAVAADQALADRFDEAASRAGREGEGIEPG
jgi:hypothetical protein